MVKWTLAILMALPWQTLLQKTSAENQTRADKHLSQLGRVSGGGHSPRSTDDFHTDTTADYLFGFKEEVGEEGGR